MKIILQKWERKISNMIKMRMYFYAKEDAHLRQEGSVKKQGISHTEVIKRIVMNAHSEINVYQKQVQQKR